MIKSEKFFTASITTSDVQLRKKLHYLMVSVLKYTNKNLNKKILRDNNVNAIQIGMKLQR